MSLDREQKPSDPISSVQQLVAYFQAAERPVETHLVGLEHEKFIYPIGGAAPVAYEGPHGIGALLGKLVPEGYHPFVESPGAPVIALEREQETISLEPGGQFELSGSPFRTAREAHAQNQRHVDEVKRAGVAVGLYPVTLGYRPYGTVEDVPWMPKRRYQAMRDVLPRRGRFAKDMMLMTCTGQVSLDWSDEQDCARKMTVTSRVSPLVVALFANSPLVDGKPSGFQSFRSQVWTDVDRARCGYFPAMVDGTFTYQSYVDWALEAPLLFLRRQGKYLEPKLTFRQLLEKGFEGERATQSDWVDHLSTLFPEVRIKKVLEVRAADCASVAMTGGLASLFRGLLYDRAALDAALALLPKLSFAEHLAFQDVARREGLAGLHHGRPLWAWTGELLDAAKQGLMRLDPGDVPLLEPLFAQAASRRSPSETVLEDARSGMGPAALLARSSA